MANNELFDAGIKVTGPFSATGSFPVDGKYIVETIAERDDHVTQNRAYDGMQVYVKENKKTYQYVIKDWVGQWKDFCDETVYRHAVENKGIAVGITMGDSTVPGLYKIKTNDEGHVVEVSPITKTDIIDLGITISGIEYGVGGDNLGLVKNGGNVTINPDGTMTAPTSGGTVDGDGGTVDGDGNAWYKGDVYVGGTSPDDGKRLATENYVNEQKPIFIATYGKTTYEEVAEAYYAGKQLYLYIDKDTTNSALTNNATNCIASLVRADGTDKKVSNFTFTCDENGISHHYSISHNKEWFSWHVNWQKQIDGLGGVVKSNAIKIDEIDSVVNNNTKKINKIEGIANSNAENITDLLPLLTSALDSFRGGFRNTAGTLSIKHPGIYFILQGGSNDKTITITQSGNTTKITKNGFIILAYDNGVGTVLGISNMSLTNLNPISTGTYQLWSPDGTYHTEVSYSDMTVVAYLGNSNNDI